jgi:hypothetical protein
MASFVMVGISCGFPWNAVITASNYLDSVFASRQDLLDSYESAISVSYLGANLLCFIAMRVLGPPSHRRAMGGFNLFTVFVFSALTITTVSDLTTGNEDAMFGALVFSALGLGAFSAAFQSAIFALAATRGPGLTRNITIGFAVAGTLASLLAIATSGADARWSGLCLFLASLVFVAAASRIDLHAEDAAYDRLSSSLGADIVSDVRVGDDDSMILLEPLVPPKRHVLWISLATVGLALGGTLAVFPALVSEFVPRGAPDSAFVPTLFLLFNIGDMVGRGIAGPLARAPAWLGLLLAVLRSLALPLFFLCKREGMTSEGMPSEERYRFDDAGVRALVLFNGLANGALYAAAAAQAPSSRPRDSADAGRQVALMTGVALAAGSVVGSVLVARL